MILASEALRAEQINRASGESEAILLKAKATAQGIDAVARRKVARSYWATQGARTEMKKTVTGLFSEVVRKGAEESASRARLGAVDRGRGG